MKWTTASLSEIATIERNSVSPSDIKSGSRYVGLDHIETGGGSIRYGSVTNGELASNKFQFGPNHILFGKLRPYLAKVVCPDFEGICSTDIVPIAPSNLVDKRYLLHFLRRPETIAWAASRATGVNLPRLSPKELASLEIPLPPLDQQRRIAAILDKADALHRKRKRAIELLDGLTQSIFLEMFGDPGRDPKGAAKIALGELIKVKSGDGLVAKDMAPNGIHPVYGGNGINGYHDQFMFEQPQLVIGRVGVYCGAVHLTEPRSWITDNALYVSEYKRPISKLYLRYALEQANLNQYAGRAAQPLVSGSRIYPVEILLPSKEDQTSFEKVILRSAELSDYCQSASSSIDLLFASLQSRAFSGQL